MTAKKAAIKQTWQTKLEKIVVGTGVGRLRNLSQFEDKVLPEIMKEFALITGQRPAARAAKQSIASFKTREGDIVGLQVTLRRGRMRDFLTRLVRVVLPRVKDFRGIDLKSVDERGNLNIGIREQFVFPEIDVEKSHVSFGLQVTVVPTVRDRARAIDLYRSLGVPLKSSATTSKR